MNVQAFIDNISFPTTLVELEDFIDEFNVEQILTVDETEWTAPKWAVEGDIKGCFDNVDHHVLIAILRKRIADEHFIGLLWKFLKAGYMEDWNYHNTYSGTPQGGLC